MVSYAALRKNNRQKVFCQRGTESLVRVAQTRIRLVLEAGGTPPLIVASFVAQYISLYSAG